MDNLFIFGAAKIGLRLKRDLESVGYHIDSFCDNNVKKVGNIFDNVQIISFEELVQKVTKMGSNIAHIVISAYNPEAIIQQIRKENLKNIEVYGATDEYLFKENYNFESFEKALYIIAVHKPRLHYFEYHVTHHCDLKCKGCGHYSNIASPCFGNFEKYKADIKRLKELYWGVKTIRLMGGEPLLNTHCWKFCRITRKVFPDAHIRVATHGCLIPQIDEKILREMRENNIGFDISQYPPTHKVKEKIEMRCIENGVEYQMSPLKNKFYIKHNSRGEAKPELEYEMCRGNHCHYLEDGKISICNTPILYLRYKNKIGIQREVCKDDIIDIYDSSLDGFRLNDYLSKPIKYCRYCNFSDLEWFEWQGNYPYLI